MGRDRGARKQTERPDAPAAAPRDKGLEAFLRDGWCARSSAASTNAATPQAWAVGLDRHTLRFSNGALDDEWNRLVRPRSRALWMRSLLTAVVYQALRHAAEVAQYGPAPRGTLWVRLALAGAQLALYAFASLDLARPRQWAILANALGYGVVELFLVASKLRPRVCPGDWLWLTYGLAWFVVPKMSALQFFPACCGSAIIVAWRAFRVP